MKGVKYSIVAQLGNTLCKKSDVLADSAVCDFHAEPNKLKVRQMIALLTYASTHTYPAAGKVAGGMLIWCGSFSI